MENFEKARQNVLKSRADKAVALEEMRSADLAAAAVARGHSLKGPSRKTAARKLKKALAIEAAALADFEAVSDPRNALPRLAADTPILLLPLRIETRFQKSKVNKPELLVRVYPDACLINTFEPELTSEELAAVRVYWVEDWRGGDGSATHKAAWTVLASRFGIGRARWLITSYRPVNMVDRPPGDGAAKLIVPVVNGTGKDEGAAIANYWLAVVVARGDAGEIALARDALVAKLGEARADALITFSQPAKASIAGNPAKAVILVCPETPILKSAGWTHAAVVDPLPDRFVLRLVGNTSTREVLGGLVRKPLHASFNPIASMGASAPGKFPDEILWMTDFDAALAAGMAFRVALSSDEAANGFKRLMVIGVDVANSSGDGAIQNLIESRLHSLQGFEIVPQGTPTNNTDEPDPRSTLNVKIDAAFSSILEGGEYSPSANSLEATDGQVFAAALGLDDALVSRLVHSGNGDQRLATAINTTLWAGTLGYYLHSLLDPVLSRATIERLRTHFIAHVKGRGAIPAIRIGKQPYGILPTMAFGNSAWIATEKDSAQREFIEALHQLLLVAEKEWLAMSARADRVGAGPDPRQTALRVLSLNATSVEFHSRLAENAEQIAARLRAAQIWADGDDIAAVVVSRAKVLLASFGHTGSDPDIMNMVFHSENSLLDGGISHELPPRPGFEGELGAFCRWLSGAMQQSLEVVRTFDGAPDGRPPRALLPILLHYAALHSYRACAVALLDNVEATEATKAAISAREASFPFVSAAAPNDQEVESTWHLLLQPHPERAAGGVQVADFISKNIHVKRQEFQHLQKVLEALEVLAKASPAAASLAFAEHVDCCSYRLDAWLLSLVDVRLKGLAKQRKGTHVGAFGWLEDVRPKRATLSPAVLPTDREKLLDPDATQPPLLRDSSNAGHVLAPSLNHAVTAAILRSAYARAESDAQRQAIGINLSSERVRGALFLNEGMRNGQSLAALLGYQFERGLQDLKPAHQTDLIITGFRAAFPYSSGKLLETANEPPGAVIEARGTVDGLALIKHFQKRGVGAYPFGLTLPATSVSLGALVKAEVDRLSSLLDALGDTSLAEATYQYVLGNYDRAAAALDAFSKGGLPPEPEVVKSVPQGISINHRVGLVLPASTPALKTPRVTAEPAIAAWLEQSLPNLSETGCVVTWGTGPNARAEVTLADLGLAWLDVIAMCQVATDQQGFAGLDDAILAHLYTRLAGQLPHAAAPTINYMQSGPGVMSLFEIGALLDVHTRLVATARPMLPGDLVPPSASGKAASHTVFLASQRVDGPLAELKALVSDLTNLHVAIDSAAVNTANHNAATLARLDSDLRAVADLHLKARRFLPNVSFMEEILVAPQTLLSELRAILLALVERFEFRLALALEDLDKADAAIGDAARDLLLKAAAYVSTTIPVADPAATLRDAVIEKINDFQSRMTDLKSLQANEPRLISDFVALLIPLAATAAFEFEVTDITGLLDDALPVIPARLSALCSVNASRLRSMFDQAAALQAAYLPLPQGQERNRKIELAAKAIFGEAFLVLLDFEIDSDAAAGIADARAAANESGTLKYVIDTMETAFPVDDWLYGLARVRKPLRTIESLLMLSDSFGLPSFQLEPLQLPHRDGDSWLGLDYPRDYDIDGERLLLTLHVAGPVNDVAPCRGLIVDEWTEMLPGQRFDPQSDAPPVHSQTAGVAFHFDRPNAEAPQSWLLALPSTADGSWGWEDLVAALDWAWSAARIRAVEPEHIDDTPYASFLPATVMAAAARDVTISAILARNIGIEKWMRT